MAYDEKKQSGLMKLLIALKNAQDINERERIEKNLEDEMSIYTYTYAIAHPYLGMEEAAEFLIKCTPSFKYFIDSFNKIGEVDFAYYFKKVLGIKARTFYREKKLKNTENAASFVYMIPEIFENNTKRVEDKALESEKMPFLYKDEKKDEDIQKLVRKKSVQDYVLSKSAFLDEDIIKEFVYNLPLIDKKAFLDSYVVLKRKKDENEDKKLYEKAVKYMLKKSSNEITKRDKTECKTSHYEDLLKKAQKKVLSANKVSYLELCKSQNRNLSSVRCGIHLGKNAIMEYKYKKKENKEDAFYSCKL